MTTAESYVVPLFVFQNGKGRLIRNTILATCRIGEQRTHDVVLNDSVADCGIGH